MDATTALVTLLVAAVAALAGLAGGVAWERGRRVTVEAQASALRSQLDAERRRESVEALVAPLRDTLTRVEAQLHDVERQRVASFASLGQALDGVRTAGDDLRRETASLVTALRRPQARGRWGELQLRRVVELAGMSEHCDVAEQVTVTDGEHGLRPDLVVRLVGGRSVVVDSKVALSAYLEAYEAADERVREDRLVAHARQLRAHVDRLADKAYWARFSPAPEFVVLFVPGDAFLAPALERDPGLLEHALARRVHLATPTTLVSLLRTVAYAWQQESLSAHAQAVFDLGRELYDRLATLGGHVDRVGRALESAVRAYNGAVGSLESRVLVSARRLRSMDLVSDDLPPPRAVEEAVRPLGAPELVDGADVVSLARADRAAPPRWGGLGGG